MIHIQNNSDIKQRSYSVHLLQLVILSLRELSTALFVVTIRVTLIELDELVVRKLIQASTIKSAETSDGKPNQQPTCPELITGSATVAILRLETSSITFLTTSERRLFDKLDLKVQDRLEIEY